MKQTPKSPATSERAPESALAEVPGSALKVGQTYYLEHCRFGEADVKVEVRDNEWVGIVVVDGELNGMSESWYPGDKKTLRISHCKFYAPNDQALPPRGNAGGAHGESK